MRKDLCIIGQEKSTSNIQLLEEAKKKFNAVFFVPLNAIGIGLSDTFAISYRTTNLLKFPAVFARIPTEYCSYAYQLLSLFPQETFMSIKPISLLIAAERFFLLTVLRKRGVETINLKLAKSKKAAKRLIEEEKYPFIIRVPDKKTGVVVENSTEARSIIDALASLDKSILIEDVVKNMVSMYIAYPDVIATVKKKSGDKDIVFSPGDYKGIKPTIEMERLALDAASAIEAQIVRVDITMENHPKVANINLNPDFIMPSKVTEKNIPARVIDSLSDNFDLHVKKPLFVKFFEDASSVIKDVLKTKSLI